MKKLRGKKVGFQLTAEPGSEVFVAGTFNQWDAGQHRMRDNPHSGVYRIALVLPPGRHEYKFVVDGGATLNLILVEEGALGGVINVLNQRNVRIMKLNKREPTLEDVFVDLVGRSMADVEQAAPHE